MAKKKADTKKTVAPKRPGPGRPSKFEPAYCEQVTKLCKLGAIDREIADFFAIQESTLNNWKLQHPEFKEAMDAGKLAADAEVASKLFHRATGYKHPDVHVSNYQGEITLTPLVKEYAPDTTAAIFWLKNRQSHNWRDRQEVTGKDGKDLIPEQQLSPLEVARRLAFLLASGVAEADNQESDA